MTFYTSDGRGNLKSLNTEIFPDSAWEYYGGKATNDAGLKLYASVSWLFRCIRIISNGVQTMPFTIERNGNTVTEFDGTGFNSALPQELIWLGRFPRQAGMIAATGLLAGEAYLERRYSLRGTTLSYDWLLPTSITPKIDETTGQPTSFKRMANNRQVTLSPEDVVWFWPPDFSVETGPAKATAGTAVLRNAGIIGNMDNYFSLYFERGMLSSTFWTYGQPLSTDERDRTKSFIRRTMSGLKNAFTVEILRNDIEPKKIGDSLSELGDHTLTDKERQAIAIGLGVPMSKLDSSVATDSNRNADDKQFIRDTVLPEIGWIYEIVNERMMPNGYTIRALPERIEVMQVEEVDKTASYVALVNAGMPPETAVALLGIDVPNDLPLTTPQAPPVVAMNEMRAAEIITEKAQFKRWYKSRIGQDWSEFTPQVLTADDVADIAGEMNQAEMQKAMMAQQAQREREFSQALQFFQKALDTQPQQQPTAVTFTLAPELKPTPVTVQNEFAVSVPEQKAGEIVVNVPPSQAPDVVVNVPETAVNITNNVDVEFPSRAREVTNVTRDSQGYIVQATTDTEYEQ